MRRYLLLLLLLLAPLESLHAAGQDEIDSVEANYGRRLPASSSATSLKHCARLSFPGTDRMIITNICHLNVYMEWSDDRGAHTTALGSGRSVDVGRYHGRPRIDGVTRQ